MTSDTHLLHLNSKPKLHLSVSFCFPLIFLPKAMFDVDRPTLCRYIVGRYVFSFAPLSAWQKDRILIGSKSTLSSIVKTNLYFINVATSGGTVIVNGKKNVNKNEKYNQKRKIKKMYDKNKKYTQKRKRNSFHNESMVSNESKLQFY